MLTHPHVFALFMGSVMGLAIPLLVLFWGVKETLIVVFMLLPTAGLALISLPSAVTKLKAVASELSLWHGLWCLLFISCLVFRMRETQDTVDNPLDVMALYRVGLVSLVAFVLLDRLNTSGQDWSRSLFQGLVGLVAGYALLSLTSTIWSSYRFWTCYKSAEYLVDIALLAAIVATLRTPNQCKSFFDVTWLLLSALIGTVWLGMLIWPADALIPGVGFVGVQLKGVLPLVDSNSLAEISGVLIVVAFTRCLFAVRHRLSYAVVAVLILPTLVLAQGRSGTTGMIAGLMLVLFCTVRARFVVPALALVGMLIYLTPAEDRFVEFFMRNQDPKYFASLSGRTDTWEVAWEAFLHRPITGFGGYAGARFASAGVADSVAHLGESASSVLSTWFELLLGVGAPGFLLMASAVVGAWVILLRRVWRAPPEAELSYRLAVEALGVLAVMTVRSIFTPNLIWHFPMMFLLVIGYAEALRRADCSRFYAS
jgi:O-antigen ligase